MPKRFYLPLVDLLAVTKTTVPSYLYGCLDDFRSCDEPFLLEAAVGLNAPPSSRYARTDETCYREHTQLHIHPYERYGRLSIVRTLRLVSKRSAELHGSDNHNYGSLPGAMFRHSQRFLPRIRIGISNVPLFVQQL